MEKISVNYLYDLKSKENMRLYYACKERFGETLPDREAFISQVTNELKEKLSGFSTIVIPQSSNDFIFRIASGLKKHLIIVKKNSIEKIIEEIPSLKLQKKEKDSHFERITQMQGSFKINALKANQRKKYQYILFEKIEVPEKETSIILDDSCFSGTTKEALSQATGVSNFMFIFSK